MSSSFLRPSSVGGLFFHGDPSTIAGFVSPVIVDAVECEPGWRLAHVSEEVVKGQPSLANGDATGAIPRPCPVTWVCAALNERRPAGIEGCGFPSEIVPVLVIKLGGFLAVKTTATGHASPDIADCSSGGVSTVTAAFPDELLSLPAAEADDGQSSETLASDIFECGHDGSFRELLRQEAARRFSGGPSRLSTIFCGRLQ